MPSASSSNVALHFSRLAAQHSRTDKSRAQEASGYFLWLLYLTGFLLINIKKVEFIKRVSVPSLSLGRGSTSMTTSGLKISVNF